MGKAPSHHQERKNTHKKPYTNNYAPSSAGAGSISKLKGSLRSAKRLLLKDGLDAALRVETERRVESLQAELKEAEAKRPATSSKQDGDGEKVKAKAADAGTTTSNESKKAKGSSKDKSKKNEKRQNVYKMLRHVEYQKTRRRFKTASKELASIVEQLEALDASNSDAAGKADKKARKNLEKQRAAREEDVLRARTDSWYVATFPVDKKYVALFPAGTYVEYPDTLPTISVSDVSNEKEVLELCPSNKKPDEVRTFWRAVVRARLDGGVLVGEPKEKKKATVDKKEKSSPAEDAEPAEPEDNDGQADDTTSSDSSEASSAGGDVDLNVGDDFFA